MATITEGKKIGDVLKREYDKLHNRETITLAAGDLALGTVLGIRTTAAAAPTAVAAAGNTGDGAMGVITPSAGVKPGAYKLVIIEPAANAGSFTVEDPSGTVIGTGNVGTAFSAGGLAFTLADGATDFVAGDNFTITVAAGSGSYAVYDPTAADGTQVAAAAVLLEAVDASAAPAKGVILARGPAVVERDALVFGAGVTTQAQKDSAYAALQAAGITVRIGVGAGIT